MDECELARRAEGGSDGYVLPLGPARVEGGGVVVERLPFGGVPEAGEKATVTLKQCKYVVSLPCLSARRLPSSPILVEASAVCLLLHVEVGYHLVADTLKVGESLGAFVMRRALENERKGGG